VNRCLLVRTVRRLALVTLCSVVPLSALRGDTIVPITGIGTSVTDAFAIKTQVESVTYSDPALVCIRGMRVLEIRGTVSGVGWGGGGVVPRAANAHYRYDIPFVARWRKDGPSKRLVFFNHGGGVALMVALKREKAVGVNNQHRTAELNGDLVAGVPALLDHAVYISINRRGLRNDGTFSAAYLAPMAPLSAAEVDGIEKELAKEAGDPAFKQPGIEAGKSVPLVPTNDAPTCRDIARALEHVVAGILKQPFQTRIAIGTSSGARLFAAFNFGRSVIGNKSVRTGGNHATPYDAKSARIFDGFILNGLTYFPAAAQVDAALPMSAPTMFLQGQGDERYQQHVTYAHELLQKGVVLDGSVWIYEVKNLPHVTRDVVAEVTAGADSDRFGCIVSAALRNLRARVEQGTPPPSSRMAGRVVNGELRFDQAGGTMADSAPAVNDPDLDKVVEDPMLKVIKMVPADAKRWLDVTAALPHVSDALTPPTVACRLGGYDIMFFGSRLNPFPPEILAARYGCFEGYRACVCRTVAGLQAQRLYDPRVESAYETAERARHLFAERPPSCRRAPRILRLFGGRW
jgi:hypothetical protein